MSESYSGLYCVAIISPSLIFKLDIEQDEIPNALIIKQETEWTEWFSSGFPKSG